MTPEITFKMAIIWKLIATLLFILVARGILGRIFKFKLVHWLVFVFGLVALFAAVKMDLVGKLISAFKKKETEYITIEKPAPQPAIITTTVTIEIPAEKNEQSIVTEPEIEKTIDEPPVPAPKTEGSPVNANNIYNVPPSNSSSNGVVPRTYGSTEGVGGNYHGERSKFGTPEKEQTVKPTVYGAPK